jgi:hypothetical protein
MDEDFSEFLSKYSDDNFLIMIHEIQKYIRTGILRRDDLSINAVCNMCKKRPIYEDLQSGKLLCWFHGMKLVKNN